MLCIKSALLATFVVIAAGQQTCPNSQWTYDAASAMCYLVGKSTLQTNNNARYYCQQQGGNLAIVHSNIVQNVIQSLAQAADPDFYYYIGLVVNGDGQFVWVDGSALDIFKWCPNNPTTVSANVCGALDANGNCWRNINCNTYLPFICLNDPSKTTTGRPTTTTPRPVSCQPDNYPPGSGMVYSPGYPGSYGNNEDCNYLLTASPSNAQISLNIITINTEACCDILSIYDGPTRFSPLIQRVSGVLSNQFYYSTGQFMTLRFVTDSSVVSTGFTGRYSTVYRTTTSRPTVGK